MPTLFQSFPNAGVVDFGGTEIGITDAGWELECDMESVPLQYEELGDYVKELYFKGYRIFFSTVIKHASTAMMNLYFGGNLTGKMNVGDGMGEEIGASLTFTPAQSSRLGFECPKAVPHPDGSINLQNRELVMIPVRFEVLFQDSNTPMIELSGGATS